MKYGKYVMDIYSKWENGTLNRVVALLTGNDKKELKELANENYPKDKFFHDKITEAEIIKFK